MKKLQLILLFLVSIYFTSNAQHTIVKNDGDVFQGAIRVSRADNVQIKTVSGEIVQINIAEVDTIKGSLSGYAKSRLFNQNPGIAFVDETGSQSAESIYPPVASQKSAGELISNAASYRLGTVAVAAVTGFVLMTDEVQSDPDKRKTVFAVGAAAGLTLYIVGELTQIKAGKILERENFTVVPASEGFGLALQF